MVKEKVNVANANLARKINEAFTGFLIRSQRGKEHGAQFAPAKSHPRRAPLGPRSPLHSLPNQNHIFRETILVPKARK